MADFDLLLDDYLLEKASQPGRETAFGIGQAARKKPDLEAELQQLSKKVGVPVETARAMPDEVKKQARLRDIDAEFLRQNFPNTAKFVTPQENADIAVDDLDNLKKHESLFGMMGDDWIGKYKQATETERFNMLTRARADVSRATPERLKEMGAKSVDPGGESFVGRAIGAFGAGVAGIGGNIVYPALQLGAELQSEIIGKPLVATGLVKRDPFAGMVEETTRWRKMFDDYIKSIGGPRKGDDFLTSSVLSGFQSAGANIPLLGASIMAAPGIGIKAAANLSLNLMGAGTAGQAYGQAREQGVSVAQALPFAVSQGVVEKYTEMLPATKLLEGLGLNQGWKGALRLFGSQLFQENWTEQVATHLQDLNEWAILPENKDKTVADYLTDRPSAALQTLIATTVGTVLQTGAAKGIDTAINNAERQRQRLFFESLGESATDSKVRQRYPERYREFVEQAVKDGPLETVAIPVEQFKEYFQSQDMSPDTVASELGADGYQEALMTGGDVVIPLGSFAEKIAPTEHLAGLMPDLRLGQGLTEREAAAAGEEQESKQAEMVSRMTELVKEQESIAPIDAAIQEITGDVEGQLVAAGTDASVARDQATIMRGIAVLANRAFPDMDPLDAARQVWGHYGLVVERPIAGFEQRQEMLDAFTKDPDFKSNFDDLMEIVRSGQVADTSAPTVMELTQRLYSLKTKSGRSRKKAGTVGVRSDTAAYDKAVQAEFEDKQAAEQDEEIPFDVPAGADLTELTAQAGKLAAYLKAAGVDIEGLTNDQVFELVQQEAGTALFQADDDKSDKLGYTKLLLDGKIKIGLLEASDLTTFLHESGHLYLEVMGDLAAIPAASQQVKDDYAAILKYLGVDSRDKIETKHHEKFAQANERYLMEGEAPSPELRGVFQRFRAWLKFIYERIRKGALTTEINDQVREVFDRIYATDAEIMRAVQELGSVNMITTPELVGWTKEQFDLYSKAVADEIESAKEDLQQRLLAEYTRESKKLWNDERKKVETQVTEESNLMPIYLAFNDLTRGTMIAGEPVKLRSHLLALQYGPEVVKSLPKSVHAADGNLDADTAASFFGFKSGDELVRELSGMVPQKKFIAARVKQIMAERHGDTLVDGTIAKKAMEAMHNEQRLKVLRMELRALKGKVDEVKPFTEPLKEQIKQGERDRAYENRFRDAEEAARRAQARQATETASPALYRESAKQVIDNAAPRNIQPATYIQASRKASRAAFEAMAKSDFVEAAIQKQRELVNHYLYLEARRAQDEVEKIVKYAKKFDTKSVRESIGKAQIGGGTFLAQIDNILNRYEFRKVPIVEIDQRQSLLQWVEAMRATGNDPVIDDRLLDEARKINFASVKMTELRSIHDALRNIEHLARTVNKLMYANKQAEFGQAKGELIAAAVGNIGESAARYSESAKPLTQNAKEALQGLDAEIIKTEQLMMWLDGDNVKGPWHEYIWNPLKEAQHALNDDTKAVVEKLDDLFQNMPKEWRRRLLDKVQLQGDTVTRTRKDLIGMALNLGNDQNRKKLIEGNFGGNAAMADQVMSRLTAQDWKFVQDTWNLIETLWPKIAAVQKRLTGLEPVKVERAPFVARDAEGNEVAKLEGGYYPLVADRLKSNVGLKQEADIFEESYISTNTSHGFTKERTGATYPLDFNFERILTHHLTQVIKDYTHREAVLAANKILLDPEIRATLQNTLGEKYEPLFRSWLKDIANDTNRSIADGLGPWSRAFTATRANLVAAIMGFKATTMISQVTSLGVSLDRVGAKHLSKSLLDYVKNPMAMTRNVYDVSGELRHRANNLDRDINLRLRAMVGKHSVKDEVQRFAFHGIAVADSITAVVTWNGAYNQAMANNKSREEAILEADAAVRLTQGAGSVMDQSAMQRNRGEFWRATTMFYSYFNALYSTGRDIGFQVDSAKDLPRALSRYFLAFVIPYVIAELILLRGPDDDKDESYLPWLARKALLSPFFTVPFLRDAANAMDSGFDIKFTPMATAIEKTARLLGKTKRDITGDRDMDFADYALGVAETAGFLFGVPGTAQFTGSAKYIRRYIEGDEEPDNMVKLLYEAGLGKRKDK